MKATFNAIGSYLVSQACGLPKVAVKLLPMLLVMAFVASMGAPVFAQEEPEITPFSISGFLEALNITGTLGGAMEALATNFAYIIGVMLGLCAALAVLAWATRPASGRRR